MSIQFEYSEFRIISCKILYILLEKVLLSYTFGLRNKFSQFPSRAWIFNYTRIIHLFTLMSSMLGISFEIEMKSRYADSWRVSFCKILQHDHREQNKFVFITFY